MTQLGSNKARIWTTLRTWDCTVSQNTTQLKHFDAHPFPDAFAQTPVVDMQAPSLHLERSMELLRALDPHYKNENIIYFISCKH